jgi:hypothetical protein
LHLSGLCALAPHLDPQNATELFTACCSKTRRQVDELLAARFPKPDVREQIRRLPTRLPVQVQVVADEPRMADRAQTHDETVVEPNATSQGPEATTAEVAEFVGDHGSETGPSVVGSPPARRRELEALSADRFGVHFTADAELKELLERERALARDCGQCSFVSEDGRRCEARALLELDHVEPWAKLGDAGLDNIRLCCRAHNQMHARECFGARHIEAKIAARRCGVVPSSGDK